MANPLTTARNKYHQNIKDSSIYTPAGVCQFLFDILHPVFRKTIFNKMIVDPSIGSGNLVKPFSKAGYKILGYDINDDPDRIKIEGFNQFNFLEETKKRDDVSFVICNPPFNTDKRNKDFLKKEKMGKALLPELFAEQAFYLYGRDIPLILFSPMGILLNQRMYDKDKDGRKVTKNKGERYRKMRDRFPEITSIISLPLDVFSGVEFHNLVLMFNIPQLKPHYFLPEKYFEEEDFE